MEVRHCGANYFSNFCIQKIRLVNHGHRHTALLMKRYYNHGQYINGWSYNSIGLGTPFITTRTDIREELPSSPEEYFINNRVMAFHFGCEGSVKSVNYIFKASWSKNYGTYWTTDEEQSTDISNPGAYGIFGEQEQFSTYLELNRELKNGFKPWIYRSF